MASVARRCQGDPRSVATRLELIECAEALIGEFGVNGVSIRQIAKSSGSANSSVVSYHFGSKDALLKEVLEQRLPGIDGHRRLLLAKATLEHLEADPIALVNALYRPFFEQRNMAGKRSYAAFVAELIRGQHIDIRTSLNADYPTTRDLLDRLAATTGNGFAPLFRQRVFLASAMVFAALRQLDHSTAADDEAEKLFTLAIEAATSVIATKTKPTHLMQDAAKDGEYF